MTSGDLYESGSSAVFSDCMRYRYHLWRKWGKGNLTLCFIMLNPSTADETSNDQTVERCQRRAVRMGFGRLDVVNIFALRSTDPQALYAAADPIGPENDEAIIAACENAGMVVCAWGHHGAHLDRAKRVLELLRHHSVKPHVLKLNADGSPAHPLYIGYDVNPVAWEPIAWRSPAWPWPVESEVG